MSLPQLKSNVPSGLRATTGPHEPFKRWFEELHPKLVLFEALAQFKDIHRERQRSTNAAHEARRDFLDSFAYLCDIEKGGSTVTAAALQELQHSNFLWLAANEGIRPGVKRYAELVLSILRLIQDDTDKAQVRAYEERVFNLVMDNCAPRVAFYLDKVRPYARNCRMQLRRETSSELVKALRLQLKKISEPPATMSHGDVVVMCYAMRGSDINSIKQRSKKNLDDFDQLAHYVGRLGATRHAAITVVRSATSFRALRRISEIRTVEAPGALTIQLGIETHSPYEIVREAVTQSPSRNPVEQHTALHALVDLDLKSNPNVRELLRRRASLTTRVHAELQLVDRFSRDGHMQFVDSDPYIGCSKPACYFCFTWISVHHRDYVLPASHQKIIPGCRAPDSGLNDSGVAVTESMYEKTCRTLEQDIIDFLLKSEREGRPQNYMSTEGSSQAPSLTSRGHIDRL